MENQVNVVRVTGVVKENKLKVDNDKVNGSLVVKYGDAPDEQTEVKVYVGAKKKDGTANKKYEKMSVLANTLISTAKATEEKPADTVTVFGSGDFTPQLRLNEYYNNGDYKSAPEVSLGFGNIIKVDTPKEDFLSEFDITVFLTKAPVMKEEEGYLEVEGVYVTYKDEVKPLTFIVRDSDLIDGIEGCEKGDTIRVWGEVKIARVTTTTETKSGFGGKAKTDVKVSYTSELLVTGGDPIDEDHNAHIDPAFVKKAMVERETFLAELEKEADAPKQTKKPTGFGGGTTTSDECPF